MTVLTCYLQQQLADISRLGIFACRIQRGNEALEAGKPFFELLLQPPSIFMKRTLKLGQERLLNVKRGIILHRPSAPHFNFAGRRSEPTGSAVVSRFSGRDKSSDYRRPVFFNAHVPACRLHIAPRFSAFVTAPMETEFAEFKIAPPSACDHFKDDAIACSFGFRHGEEAEA